MAPGWRAIVKTAALTAALTTAFWFAVAAWLSQRHVVRERPSPVPQAVEQPSAQPRAQGVAGEPRLIIPVTGVRAEQLVDTYSEARASGARHHDAIDIMAPRGTPVIAAAAGQVEKLFLSKDGGNTVYVRSPDRRRIYYYAHLDRYAPGLGEGAVLRQGASIGAVGSTGNADPAAPHLHFAIWITSPERKWWEEATAIDPYPLLTQARASATAR